VLVARALHRGEGGLGGSALTGAHLRDTLQQQGFGRVASLGEGGGRNIVLTQTIVGLASGDEVSGNLGRCLLGNSGLSLLGAGFNAAQGVLGARIARQRALLDTSLHGLEAKARRAVGGGELDEFV